MLVYSVDRAFLPLACISIGSMVANCVGDPPPVTLLLHDIDERSRRDAVRYLTQLGIAFHLVEVNAGWCQPWARERRQSPAKFGPLRLGEFIVETVGRIVVVDADVRFVDDISRLFQVDMEGHILAAVDDIAVVADGRVGEFRDKLGLPATAGYFNSGLMVIDPPKWRADAVGEQAVEVFKRRPHILTFNDQCALNAVIQGRYKRLPFRWNHLVGSTPSSWLASVYHYAGHFKPWRPDLLVRYAGRQGLMGNEHTEFYRTALATLRWHEPLTPAGWAALAARQRLLAKMLLTGRFQRYRRRSTSPYLAELVEAHPELVT